MAIQIRPATSSDAAACGRIAYEAFVGIAGNHGFPADFPDSQAALGLAQSLIENPAVFGVVAERDGTVAGSNFLMEGDAIRGVGPITVDPKTQGAGIGRKLMESVLDRASGAKGIRLLQDSFNMRSISLYASLGFAVREPMIVMRGRPSGIVPQGVIVRAMRETDIDDCDALCRKVHDISRRNEIAEAVRHLSPLVAEQEGRIRAYATAPGFWIGNHGVAQTTEDMKALLIGAAAMGPLAFLLPARQDELLRWCLAEGMRSVKPMTLMTIGDYSAPERPYLPSVFY